MAGSKQERGEAAFLALASHSQASPGGQCGGVEALHPITLSGRTDHTAFKPHLAGAIEGEGQGGRRQLGSQAQLLPLSGSKALLNSEK